MAIHTENVVRLFVPLYKSICFGGYGEPFYGLSLLSAECMGKAKCLYLHETYGPFPSMSSIVYSWWSIDVRGVSKLAESPYPECEWTSAEYIQKPKIKFTHSDEVVIFGLSFGTRWYVKAEVIFCKSKIIQLNILADYRRST